MAQAACATALWVGTGPHAGAVALDGAHLVCSEDADELERFVCGDLAADFSRVGLTLSRGRDAPHPAPLQIWFGRPGHHPAIDALAAQGRIDLRPLTNCWECFHLELVRHPAPGVPWALVVAGADLPIPQHAYCPSWGHPPCRVTRLIVSPEPSDGPGSAG